MSKTNKRILFMTVGTGIGPDKDIKIKSLAHGLLTSIRHYKPDFIVFFGSELSKETIEQLKSQYLNNFNQTLKNYQFELLKNIDSFEDCFNQIKIQLLNYKNDEIIIDYTSGTKTMTISAAITAALFHKNISLITGTRKNGHVLSGTEKIIEQNLYSVYDLILMEKLIEQIDRYDYEQAIITLNNIKILPEDYFKESLENIIKGFEAWDKFDHNNALNFLKSKKIHKYFKSEIHSSLAFLANIVDKKIASLDNKIDKTDADIYPFLIIDLFQNAIRRIERERFDDAIARLYRCTEMIAQYILLNEFQLDSSNLDLESLKKILTDFNLAIVKDQKNKKTSKNYNAESIQRILDKYVKLEDDDNKGSIKIGLWQDYELLKDLGHDAGTQFFENNHLRQLLTKRNSSILAHGIEPLHKEDAIALKSLVEHFIQKFVSKTPGLIKLATFPKLSGFNIIKKYLPRIARN
ncbi:MAG: TIGR02710 family CRISPR-associated CARF protein [Promethearchaeota archaeon]